MVRGQKISARSSTDRALVFGTRNESSIPSERTYFTIPLMGVRIPLEALFYFKEKELPVDSYLRQTILLKEADNV